MSLKKFAQLAGQYNLVTLQSEQALGKETPVSIFQRFRNEPYAFLFESVEGGSQWARYTFIGFKPLEIFRSRGKQCEWCLQGGTWQRKTVADPLAVLEKRLHRYQVPKLVRPSPFAGGVVGYLGYDMVRFIEKLPVGRKKRIDAWDSYWMIPQVLLVIDNKLGSLRILYHVPVKQKKRLGKCYTEAKAELRAIAASIGAGPVSGETSRQGRPGGGLPGGTPEPPAPPNNRCGDGWPEDTLLGRAPATTSSVVRRDRTRRHSAMIKRDRTRHPAIQSLWSRRAYEAGVRTIKRYIEAGDCIQVVLSLRLQTPFGADPFDLYQALRSLNPSPYMYYLHFEDHEVVGASPETMVRSERGELTIRPIAGTRPRGKNKSEDNRLAKELLADPKERAEHIMLVDLARNDLGRVAVQKSVQVDELMAIERYSHVMHIVSNVRARLQKGMGPFDVLRASFPAGTLSGAPKVRAMQIIDALEPTLRGIYGGLVGYIDFRGNLDSAIAIRTAIVRDKVAWIQAGAGIVADSDPKREYDECMNKTKGVLKAVELAEKGELK